MQHLVQIKKSQNKYKRVLPAHQYRYSRMLWSIMCSRSITCSRLFWSIMCSQTGQLCVPGQLYVPNPVNYVFPVNCMFPTRSIVCSQINYVFPTRSITCSRKLSLILGLVRKFISPNKYFFIFFRKNRLL